MNALDNIQNEAKVIVEQLADKQIKRLEDRLRATTDTMSAVIMQLKINRLKELIKKKRLT